MDILFLIKSEHDKLHEALQGMEEECEQGRLSAASFQPLFERLQVYIALDRELLYPELSELFADSQKVIAMGHAQHERILQLLAENRAALAEGQEGPSGALVAEVRSHLAQQQEQVIPRLRQLIPTQEREDLGQVYLDMKEEVAGQVSSPWVREQVG